MNTIKTPDIERELKEIKKLQIQYVNIDKIVPYKNNPRKNDKAVDIVATSIKEFGFKNPIILDKDNVIVAGHTRLKAATKLGMTEVPVIWANDLTETQIKAFRIMDNKSQEYATWDLKILVDELKDLNVNDVDLSFTGIPETELNRLMKDLNEQTKGNKKPKYKINQGDVYKLGIHKLKCGDSTKEETYNFIDKQVDLIFTDPPYGVSYTGQIHYDIANPEKGKGREWQMISGDDLRGEDLYIFLKNELTEMNKKFKSGGAFYCFYASKNHIIFEKALNDSGLTVKQILIWNKHHVLGRSDYHWTHEPIMYGHKNGTNCQFYGDRIDKTILNKPLTEELLKELDEQKVREILKNIIQLSDLWTIKKDNSKDYVHPTQKPKELAKRAIINSCPKNGTVLDPFGGSGSTLMACQDLNRECFTIEFDETFCSHIIERWETKTGQVAVKL